MTPEISSGSLTEYRYEVIQTLYGQKPESIERLFLSGLQADRRAMKGVYGITNTLNTKGCSWPTPAISDFEIKPR